MRPRHREHHRSNRTGWLRAAVLGANDGIVSTASLVIGVAHQRFQWYLDDVRIPAGDALRCFIEPA